MPNKCLKCNQFFKDGEEYVEVSNNPKAGTYHESCWAEIEQEQQSGNNQPICKECKKPIKVGEEYAEEEFPDAFQSHTVRYHKSCWEKKQSRETPLPGSPQWIENNKCRKCGTLAVGGYCQICISKRNIRERERERK